MPMRECFASFVLGMMKWAKGDEYDSDDEISLLNTIKIHAQGERESQAKWCIAFGENKIGTYNRNALLNKTIHKYI